MIFYFKQIGGLIQWCNKRALFDWLLSHGDYKGEYIVTIEKYKAKRSLDQNALYWFYLKAIEDDTGNLATDLHELFKRKFLPPVFKTIMGVSFKVPASTTDLNKIQMGEYLDKICAFTNVPIPKKMADEFDIKVAYANLEVPEGEVKF